MKAMILAAGLGTRLRPLTNNQPKALVKIKDKTLLKIAIENLIRNGFNNIIINVHHFAEQIITYIERNKFEANIEISNESDLLLDTGGGLKKTSWFFDDGKPFLVYNVDIISNLDLNNLYNQFINLDCVATLVVRERKSSRYLLFDDESLLCGWENVKDGSLVNTKPISKLKGLAFSGIHLLDPKIFSLMPAEKKFSIIDLYLKIMREHKIKGFLDTDSFWLDAGKLENLEAAESSYDKLIS